MANLMSFTVYQINQHVLPLATLAQRIAFPTQGMLVRDTSASPTRSLSTGVNVYSALQGADGTLYYVTETISQIVTAAG